MKVSNIPSKRRELIPHYYWSTRRVGQTLANSEILFFNYVVGQTIDNVVANEVDTNMKKAGAIEHPNRFWLSGISLFVLPNTGINTATTILDINNILTYAKFTLKVSTKEKIVIAPITDLLANSQIVNANFQTIKKEFTLKRPELLMPEITFEPSLKFGSDMPNLTATATKIIMRLNGHLVRLAEL